MTTLPYTVIHSNEQYLTYCDQLEQLVQECGTDHEVLIELLTLLIEDWDRRQQPVWSMDPIQIVNGLLDEHGLKPVDLARILDLSPGAVSNILHYRRRLTAAHIRILADHFKVRQEALNQHYDLHSEGGASKSDISIRRILEAAVGSQVSSRRSGGEVLGKVSRQQARKTKATKTAKSSTRKGPTVGK